ncbi:MAG TPA: tRNA (adenosine(37)-N6)-threonylcarbamoyltransferase complex ATPase subunit type 1 TsaE [Bacteroidetes bacterium]|nr:tRNA (adenosine(37)-N6)-threonylcarbamoyltransferase complex ATPase subunit type 1 TsaE [Bacteroidota bacterium]HIL57266.1 tRNA (adenosine(37)-N6)-threonylcarbamoyltransferase complex ATPase subunit type 1 TsaE [Rhodothermales bacterium]
MCSDLLPAATASVAETIHLGEQIAARLQPGDVVALTGDLGAGKTHLAKGLVRGLGGDPEAVTSPTFVLVTEHATDPPVRHLDLYRLETEHELDSIGLDELLNDPEHVTLVEWPERARDRFPAHTLVLRLSHEGGDQRRIEQAEALPADTP